MQQIKTNIIPLESQRYATLGDYYEDENDKNLLHFKISDTGNDTYNKVILVHELVEQILTEYQGVKEPDILAFDLWVEEEIKAGRYPEDEEPGDHPLAPYRKQHDFAMNIERQIMNFLGIDFKQYDKAVMSTFEK
jgi:hypothetical protein